MSMLRDKFYTPKELDEMKILSLVQQWKERDRGRLKCYRIGRKILYGEQHLADYFSLCEVEAQNKAQLKRNNRNSK
jgi:hypothetical protein